MTQIQCRCGELQVELAGEPVVQFYCHCDDCQAAYGGAYIPIAMYPAPAVKVTRGSARRWIYKATPRNSCPSCGTRVYSEISAVGLCGVNGLLLPRGQFQPQFHIQCQHALLPVRDSLPHFKAFPARFGGSDELVDW